MSSDDPVKSEKHCLFILLDLFVLNWEKYISKSPLKSNSLFYLRIYQVITGVTSRGLIILLNLHSISGIPWYNHTIVSCLKTSS